MLTQEQREARKNTLGASEIHKIMNFDNKGAQDLWKEKVGLLERKRFENQYTIFGNLTEEDCLRFYFVSNKIENYEFNGQYEHKRIKDFVASLDAIYGDTPVENKSMNFEDFTKIKKLPQRYYLQVQTQMACVGKKAKKGIVLLNAVKEKEYGSPLEYKTNHLKQDVIVVERDDEIIKEIEDRAEYFLSCVKAKRQPNEADYLTRQF